MVGDTRSLLGGWSIAYAMRRPFEALLANEDATGTPFGVPNELEREGHGRARGGPEGAAVDRDVHAAL